MSDPLRRNLLRKGRCCRFLLRRWNLLTFLILLKFRKALSRCMSAHEAVSVTGKDGYPWVNYSHCDVSLWTQFFIVIGTSRFRLIKPIKLSYHSQLNSR